MLIRILALLFLFSACSGTAVISDMPEEEEETKELKFIFNSQADAAEHVAVILAETPYPLRDSQRAAINDVAATYTVESLNAGKEARSKLRREVIGILDAEQVEAWKAHNQKKKRSVTIE